MFNGGFKMEIPYSPLGLFFKAWGGYRNAKLDEALERLAAEEVTVEELRKTDGRFNAFIRMLDAFDTCSSNTMMDVMIKFLVEGIHNGDVDNKPDFFQIVLANLGKLTELEIEILIEMKRRRMTDGITVGAFSEGGALEHWVADKCGVSLDTAQAVIVGISRSGFTQSRHSSYVDLYEPSPMSHRLTGMAELLFDLIYHRIES